jgi:hypothetical protein
MYQSGAGGGGDHALARPTHPTRPLTFPPTHPPDRSLTRPLTFPQKHPRQQQTWNTPSPSLHPTTTKGAHVGVLEVAFERGRHVCFIVHGPVGADLHAAPALGIGYPGIQVPKAAAASVQVHRAHQLRPRRGWYQTLKSSCQIPSHMQCIGTASHQLWGQLVRAFSSQRGGPGSKRVPWAGETEGVGELGVVRWV